MGMSCDRIRELLPEYRSDILSAGKRGAVESHLASCEACADELRSLDAVLDMVESNVPDHEPPVGLWNGVRNRITAPEPRRVSARGIAGGLLDRPIRAASLGAAVLALVAAFVVGTVSRPPDYGLDFASADNTYVQAHALSAAHSSPADRVSYLSVVVAAQDEMPRGEVQ